MTRSSEGGARRAHHSKQPAAPAAAPGAKRLQAIREEFARFIEATGLQNSPESALLFAKERGRKFALSESQIVMALHGRLPFGYGS